MSTRKLHLWSGLGFGFGFGLHATDKMKCMKCVPPSVVQLCNCVHVSVADCNNKIISIRWNKDLWEMSPLPRHTVDIVYLCINFNSFECFRCWMSLYEHGYVQICGDSVIQRVRAQYARVWWMCICITDYLTKNVWAISFHSGYYLFVAIFYVVYLFIILCWGIA